MPGPVIPKPKVPSAGRELFFQLISRLGLELPPGEGENPFAQLLGTDPYTPDDEPYLRQYMGISKDGGLVPTNLRPQSLTVKDDLPWYRPAANPITAISTHRSTGQLPRTTALAGRDIGAMKTGDIVPLQTPTVPGLGHFTASVGKGQSDPYLSVYDKWDFDSPVVSPIMREMMTRNGKGFHVYERYPLQKTPNGSYTVGGDIQLPEESK